jgi:hypothetical protein
MAAGYNPPETLFHGNDSYQLDATISILAGDASSASVSGEDAEAPKPSNLRRAARRVSSAAALGPGYQNDEACFATLDATEDSDECESSSTASEGSDEADKKDDPFSNVDETDLYWYEGEGWLLCLFIVFVTSFVFVWLSPFFSHSIRLNSFQRISKMKDSLLKFTQLSSLAEEFRSVAQHYAKVIVSELSLKAEKKQIAPISLGGIAGGEKFVCRGTHGDESFVLFPCFVFVWFGIVFVFVFVLFLADW